MHWVKPHLHLTQHSTVSRNGDEGRLKRAVFKNCLTIALKTWSDSAADLALRSWQKQPPEGPFNLNY